MSIFWSCLMYWCTDTLIYWCTSTSTCTCTDTSTSLNLKYLESKRNLYFESSMNNSNLNLRKFSWDFFFEGSYNLYWTKLTFDYD